MPGVGAHHDVEPARARAPFRRHTVGDVLAQGALDVGFQPVVELRSRDVVGYEALTRGPSGTDLEDPHALFHAARGAGRLDELDWLCQKAALRGALDAGLRAPAVLFLNIEADTSGFMPLDLRALYARATAQMTVAVEVTERALTERPAALLGHVADMRALGCTIALDDVGTEVDSVAMMALLAPEVIKLDLGLIERAGDRQIADLIAAVTAQAERSAATILVERIETPRQAELAAALGAKLAQGYLFGRRARLVTPADPPGEPVVVAMPRRDPRDATPFAIVSEARPVRRAARGLMVGISRHLEEHARNAGQEAVLIGAFERDELFSPATRRRWSEIARRVAFCGALGEAMAPEPIAGVRGGLLHHADRLAREWAVTVVSPHFAAVLTGYDRSGGDGDGEEYEFVLTYDRELAVAAAASLMARITS
jgi:EAL domain-containing protein (putative c-di-GMP-specific phosphodiesterase class I)